MDPAKRKWYDQRQSARRRGIEWDLPFEVWMKIWNDSGHWHQRGTKTRDQYVMSRRGDQGPYRADNVVIKTNYENIMEGNVGRAKPQRKLSCLHCRQVLPISNLGQHYMSAGCQKKAPRTGLFQDLKTAQS